MGNFQPVGMANPVQLYQILADRDQSSQHQAAYDEALRMFESGKIKQAIATLTPIESMEGSHSAVQFLLGFLKQPQSTVATDGIIRMREK